MSKILLDYAISFTQVSGTAATSLAFLHNLGVITKPPAMPATAVIGVPSGTTTVAATIVLDGFFLAGSVLTCSGTKTDTPPLTWNAPYTLTEDLTAAQLAIIYADFLSGVDQLTATAVGNTIELRAFNGGLTVGVDVVDLDVTGAIPLASQIIEVFDPEELATISDSPEDIVAAFDGGLASVFVIMAVDIADVPALILDKECDFFTIYATRDYTEVENLTALAGWQGVKGLTYTIQADAETAASEINTCAFFEDTLIPLDARAYFGIFSFAKLLSSNSWRNQQYTPIAAANGAPVQTLGQAESLFADRISFYLTDPEQGTRLAFFVAGGLSITDPYIDMEVQVVTQSEMLNFIAGTQPYNVETRRRQLEQIGNTILGAYTDAGLLDPDGVNECIIRTSNEAFIVNGTITTTNSEALWRVKLDAMESTAV